MKCPHCKKTIHNASILPSGKQLLAYKLVHVCGMTQDEAAAVMGIKQPAIANLLKRLNGLEVLKNDEKRQQGDKLSHRKKYISRLSETICDKNTET